MSATAPEVGMMADHKSGTLDPRPVARVRRCGRGWQVWLQIGSIEAGPIPASNYRYTPAPRQLRRMVAASRRANR